MCELQWDEQGDTRVWKHRVLTRHRDEYPGGRLSGPQHVGI